MPHAFTVLLASPCAACKAWGQCPLLLCIEPERVLATECLYVPTSPAAGLLQKLTGEDVPAMHGRHPCLHQGAEVLAGRALVER